jgi:predicted Fe-Mo cluster-binding NifX family protein
VKEDEMIVAIVKDGEQVSSHYGQSEGFVLAEVDDGAVKSRSTVASPAQHSCGGLAELFVQHQVNTVIVGGIGGGAIGHLNAAGINVVAGASGDIESVLASYIDGSLIPGEAACGGEHGKPGQCHHH